jgi:hypothetical protein
LIANLQLSAVTAAPAQTKGPIKQRKDCRKRKRRKKKLKKKIKEGAAVSR